MLNRRTVVTKLPRLFKPRLAVFFLILFSKSIFPCIVEVLVIFLLVFFFFLIFFILLLLWKTFYFYPGKARYCKCPGRFFRFFNPIFLLLLCAKCGIRGAQKPPEAFCLWKTMSRHFRLLYTMNRFNIRRASYF